MTAAISSISVGDGPWAAPVALGDLELLYNYNTSTIIGSESEAAQIDVNRQISTGLAEPYVLHTILATSALHLYYKNRARKELFARGSHLQSLALQLAQPHIEKLSIEQSIPQCLFSSLTAKFALAEVMLNPHDPAETRDPIEEIINCFQLTRGIRVVVSPFYEHLRQSWLGPTFDYKDNREELRPTLSTDFPTMGVLTELALQLDTEERRTACITAIEELFTYIAVFMTNPENHACLRLITAWPNMAGKAYMDMLYERHPLALVILAYFAILLHMRRSNWYINGWSEFILRHVDSLLGDEWEPVLKWPRDVILGASSSVSPTVIVTE